ncbi:ROK family transcriptional regulator [Amycolatopsis benzoatilytica]|uniref:ROK family transcriptional regulator n=1 Tax=Amycolatopsis benzoatilytica TaxID=346045 RepID=UPI000375B742|nr:ROK family transcriptional regulator [Amycolatopsis benzoatilytica]
MTQPVRHDAMRARNLELVLGEISRGGPVTRAALAERTGLTKSTVSTLVGALLEAGFLAEQAAVRAGERGRPGVEVSLSGARLASLGLEINVDYLAACVLDLTSTVRRAVRLERDNRREPASEVLRAVAELAASTLAEARELGLTVAGAVLAVSGPVRDGVVLSAPNLGWQNVPVVLDLPLPVSVDNEANLGALGELWFGAGSADFLYVSGEIGIGAGLVVGSRLFRGTGGLAGELGHVLVSPAGPACRCGAVGCLETYAGQEAMLAAAGVGTVDEFAAALAGEDAAALSAAAAAGEALGLALASAVNLMDVDRVVLGGVFGRLFRWLAPAAEAVLTARLGSLRGSVPVLSPSALGDSAATLGAAGRTVHRVLADPAPFLS